MNKTKNVIMPPFLADDMARCSNEKCNKKLNCKRYLDKLPFENYWFDTFNENECKYYIKYF